MTIVTDFVGSESAVETHSRIAAIASYYGVTPQETWGNIRAGLNAFLPTPIDNGELAGSFLPKINSLNRGDMHWLNDLGGVVMWYDPSDLSTLFQDRAGTVPVTAPGQLVGVQRDKGPGGFHKTAINDAARGTLMRHPASGVRNLARGSGSLSPSSGAWREVTATTSGITVTPVGIGVDPDGGVYRLFDLEGTTGPVAFIDLLNSGSSRVPALPGQTYTASATVQIVSGNPGSDMTSGLRLTSFAEIAPTTEDGSTISATSRSTSEVLLSVSHTLVNGTSNQARASFLYRVAAGDTINCRVKLKSLQFERGAVRTAWQSVNDAAGFDVTEAGVPDVWSIRPDGLNTGYVTPVVTPGTDKAQVFAAVRKLSDAARAMVTETGIAQSAGILRLEAPSATPGIYVFAGGGTTPATLAVSAAAPDTSVLAGLFDIAGDSAVMRRNGVQVNSSTGDQGTGAFDAYPLYFYRRGGTSLPFNGNAYGEVIRFGPPLTPVQIAQTERWLAGKCGVTL